MLQSLLTKREICMVRVYVFVYNLVVVPAYLSHMRSGQLIRRSHAALRYSIGSRCVYRDASKQGEGDVGFYKDKRYI